MGGHKALGYQGFEVHWGWGASRTPAMGCLCPPTPPPALQPNPPPPPFPPSPHLAACKTLILSSDQSCQAPQATCTTTPTHPVSIHPRPRVQCTQTPCYHNLLAQGTSASIHLQPHAIPPPHPCTPNPWHPTILASQSTCTMTHITSNLHI